MPGGVLQSDKFARFFLNSLPWSNQWPADVFAT
jgi:hypothetical protein